MSDNEKWRGQPALAEKSRGTGPFYVVALAASLWSLDTAARFVSEELNIHGLEVNGFSLELAAICGIGEMTLIACGYAMRHNVRREGGKPGPAQLVALAMCGASAFMAFALDGPWTGGAVRAIFGPVLALVTLHLALGIEVRVRRGTSNGTLARVGRELRERAMSRLGLADDGRDAAERTRHRAADRAARLATGGWWLRRWRLARAVRAAGVALDGRQKDRMLRQVAALKTLDSLMAMRVESPWQSTSAPKVSLTKDRPAPAVTPALLQAAIAEAVELAVERSTRAIESRPRISRTIEGSVLSAGSTGGESTGRLEAKRRQADEAVAYVRLERAANREPTAAEVGRKYGLTEAWGQKMKTRARAESPNGHGSPVP